jgi:hypothetical protein
VNNFYEKTISEAENICGSLLPLSSRKAGEAKRQKTAAVQDAGARSDHAKLPGGHRMFETAL